MAEIDVKKFIDADLYGLLDIQVNANEQEIRKAYRKKALTCHPDKNPDNPKAAERFHLLSKALEILSNISAKAAYDRILLARKAAEIRNRQLDSKRQKLQADLEAKEKQAESKSTGYSYNKSSKTPEELFKEEFDRLRREGSKLLEEEHEFLRKEINQQIFPEAKTHSSTYRLKLKWKSDQNDTSNGGYTEDALKRFLNKYGDIVAIVMSGKKGRALVEFEKQEAAEMAMQYEKGTLENPLQFEWIDNVGKPKKKGTTVTDQDFESVVLRQLRQAEERKRLIEQMMNEDAEENS